MSFPLEYSMPNFIDEKKNNYCNIPQWEFYNEKNNTFRNKEII